MNALKGGEFDPFMTVLCYCLSYFHFLGNLLLAFCNNMSDVVWNLSLTVDCLFIYFSALCAGLSVQDL